VLEFCWKGQTITSVVGFIGPSTHFPEKECFNMPNPLPNNEGKSLKKPPKAQPHLGVSDSSMALFCMPNHNKKTGHKFTELPNLPQASNKPKIARAPQKLLRPTPQDPKSNSYNLIKSGSSSDEDQDISPLRPSKASSMKTSPLNISSPGTLQQYFQSQIPPIGINPTGILSSTPKPRKPLTANPQLAAAVENMKHVAFQSPTPSPKEISPDLGISPDLQLHPLEPYDDELISTSNVQLPAAFCPEMDEHDNTFIADPVSETLQSEVIITHRLPHILLLCAFPFRHSRLQRL